MSVTIANTDAGDALNAEASAAVSALIASAVAGIAEPTSDQLAALAGTSGAPNAANPFVTTSDSRLGASGGLGGLVVVAMRDDGARRGAAQ